MKVKSFINPTPHLLLEDVFSDDELNRIWSELDFLHPSLLSGNSTNPATNEEGVPLKKNSGRFLYQIYNDHSVSPIHQYLTQVAFNSSLCNYWTHNWISYTYSRTNWDDIMISYYKDKDCYLPHQDNAMFTLLIWLWKEPKQFSGGNFCFTDSNTLIECKNNCGILFMSGERHQVDELQLKREGFGRYCITMFSGITNQRCN